MSRRGPNRSEGGHYGGGDDGGGGGGGRWEQPIDYQRRGASERNRRPDQRVQRHQQRREYALESGGRRESGWNGGGSGSGSGWERPIDDQSRRGASESNRRVDQRVQHHPDPYRREHHHSGGRRESSRDGGGGGWEQIRDQRTGSGSDRDHRWDQRVRHHPRPGPNSIQQQPNDNRGGRDSGLNERRQYQESDRRDDHRAQRRHQHGTSYSVEEPRRRGRSRDPHNPGRRVGHSSRHKPPRLPPGQHDTLTNLFECRVSNLLTFSAFSFSAKSKDDKPIESVRHVKHLIMKGLRQRLEKLGMNQKDLNAWLSTVAVSGTTFFSAKPLPIEVTDDPVICDPEQFDGDRVVITSFELLTVPNGLETTAPNEVHGDQSITVDFRCKNCLFSARTLAGIEDHCREAKHEAVTSNDPKGMPANPELFLTYLNLILERSLGMVFIRWGKGYVDANGEVKTMEGATSYTAYHANFQMIKSLNNGDGGHQCNTRLVFVVDVHAKVMRTTTLHDSIFGGRSLLEPFSDEQKMFHCDQWHGKRIISRGTKKTFFVENLLFGKSPAEFPVPNRVPLISHAEYFRVHKKEPLKFPNAPCMVEVMHGGKPNYWPLESVCGDDLSPDVKEALPGLTSFTPEERSYLIRQFERKLLPAKENLLPAIGVAMQSERLLVTSTVMEPPEIYVRGLQQQVSNTSFFVNDLSRANFHVHNGMVDINVVIVRHKDIPQAVGEYIYSTLRNRINRLQSKYRLPEKPYQIHSAPDAMDGHVTKVVDVLSTVHEKPNLFFLDLELPLMETASGKSIYGKLKQHFACGGWLSQFINFRTYFHRSPQDRGSARFILEGCARQMILKLGATIWWCRIPPSIPLPAVLVGVDVFHAPACYNRSTRGEILRKSCAAVVVQVIHEGSPRGCRMQFYSQAFEQKSHSEDQLGGKIEETVRNAVRELKLTSAKSFFVFRDGVGDSEFEKVFDEARPLIHALPAEVPGDVVPMAFIVCQKRIATKFLMPDGRSAMPAGTVVNSLQALNVNQTYYIQGTAPPKSTPRPVRFVVGMKDGELENIDMASFTWQLMHEYPNWSGPIKVPAVTQMAHKLAEHCGAFPEECERINGPIRKTLYFL